MDTVRRAPAWSALTAAGRSPGDVPLLRSLDQHNRPFAINMPLLTELSLAPRPVQTRDGQRRGERGARAMQAACKPGGQEMSSCLALF